jgi:hypothetical protein
MTKLVRTASICLMIAIVALLLVTINVTGEQSTPARSMVEATNTMPAIPTEPATPPLPPTATPANQAFAPIVYDTLSTPTTSPTPTSTQQVEVSRTLPATPP